MREIEEQVAAIFKKMLGNPLAAPKKLMEVWRRAQFMANKAGSGNLVDAKTLAVMAATMGFGTSSPRFKDEDADEETEPVEPEYDEEHATVTLPRTTKKNRKDVVSEDGTRRVRKGKFRKGPRPSAPPPPVTETGTMLAGARMGTG